MRTFFASFQAKLLGCFLAVAALSMLAPIFYVRPLLHQSLLQSSLKRSQQETLLVGALLEGKRDDAALAAVAGVLEHTATRLTIMNPQGDVLLDSSRQGGSLPESHADRPEVQEAMRSGQGSATRFSTTLQSEFLYTALRLENGDIIRLATPFTGVKQRIDAQLTGLSLAGAVAVALSLLLAWFFSSRIKLSLADMMRVVEGISLGEFSRRLRTVPGMEFQPLADAVNRMAHSIEESLQAQADQKSQLEAVLETMGEGVLVLGPKGRVRRINRALAAYFPHTIPVEGKQVVELIPSPALQEAVSALLSAPDSYGKSVTMQITANTEAVFAVLLARPFKEAAASLGLVAVFHNITELVRLEAVRRDFVANVSHELRTPLTAIQGYAETLEDMDNMPEQGRRFAEIIRKHSTFLSNLVDELLTLSRLESDNFSFAPSPVDPAHALHRASQVLQLIIKSKRLRLTENIAPDTLVRADAALLERVFRNLLENACRYAPEESEISIRAHTDGDTVVFTVRDQGPGIPSAELDRIFERFYQVEKHRGATNGLGLAICKHIIERHQGRIWAESPAGDAATAVSFTLPRAAAPGGENK